MSHPATDPDSPRSAHAPRPRWLLAVGWAVAAAVSTGGLWAGVLVVARFVYGVSVLPDSVPGGALALGLGCAPLGAVYGVLIGAAVGFFCGRGKRAASVFEFATIGVVFGSLACALGPTVAAAVGPLAHPIASSSLGVCVAGFLTGLFGYHWSHRLEDDTPDEFPQPAGKWSPFTAAGWALATAFCTAGAWGTTLFVMGVFLGVTPLPAQPRTDVTLLFVGSGAVFGLLAGIGLALRSGSGERGAAVPTLGGGGALFGALIAAAGILSAPAVGERPHPLVSSSLAMTVVGFLAGLSAYAASRWIKPYPHDEAAFAEDEADPPVGARAEWVLREPSRKWRVNRPLVRVMPVLLAAVWAFGGAVLLAPGDAAVALFAVGVLGLAAAFVLYRQEERLEALEQRLRDRRET